MWFKILAVLLIVLGEAFALYAEVGAMRGQGAAAALSSSVFWRAAIPMTLGGLLLIAGYMAGYVGYRDAWIVGAISVCSIIIFDPLITYALFRELPHRGAAVGIVLGFLGMLSALFWK